jgi:hypothetical protein
MRELAGVPILNWWNAELPKIQNLRVDLLGESPDGCLVHLELQSRKRLEYGHAHGRVCSGHLPLVWRIPAANPGVRRPVASNNC